MQKAKTKSPRPRRTERDTGTTAICPAEEDAITVVSDRLLTNTWETGRSSLEFAKAWGTTEGWVNRIYSLACDRIKATLNPTTICLMHSEFLYFLAKEVRSPKATRGERIRAASAIVRGTGEMIRHPNFGKMGQNQGGQGKSAYQVLVDAGWKPPNTLPGLPAPTVFELLPAPTVKEPIHAIETVGTESDNDKAKV